MLHRRLGFSPQNWQKSDAFSNGFSSCQVNGDVRHDKIAKRFENIEKGEPATPSMKNSASLRSGKNSEITSCLKLSDDSLKIICQAEGNYFAIKYFFIYVSK